LIERVHGVSPLLTDAVIVLVEPRLKTAQIELTTPGETPDRIVLPGRGGRPRLSMVHEAGHVIDLLAHGVQGESSAMYAIEWDRWRSAVLATDHYRELRAFRAIEDDAVHRDVNYSLQLDELWACSYAQYIAVRSGSAALKQELTAFFFQSVGDVEFPRQWDDDDFVPVMEAIDALFETLGWRT
jgi:hypothetical protein